MISFFSLAPRVAFSRVGWFSGALAFRYPGYQRFFLACNGELRSVGRSEKVTYYLGFIRVIKEKVVVSACKENHFYRSQHLRPPFAFTSSTKCENKHFHAVVVQWRKKKRTTKRATRACFDILNQLLFLPFSLTSLWSLLKLPIETPAVEKSGVDKISWVVPERLIQWVALCVFWTTRSALYSAIILMWISVLMVSRPSAKTPKCRQVPQGLSRK